MPFVEAAVTDFRFPWPLLACPASYPVNPLSPKSDQHQFSPKVLYQYQYIIKRKG